MGAQTESIPAKTVGNAAGNSNSKAHQGTTMNQNLSGESKSTQSIRSPIPSKEQCVQTARILIEEKILSKGGKMPSEKAVQLAANLIGLKAHKDLQARAQKDN